MLSLTGVALVLVSILSKENTKTKISFSFMYVCVWILCTRVDEPTKAKERHQIPWSCHPSGGCLRLKMGSLEEQQILVTSEPLSVPLNTYLFYFTLCALMFCLHVCLCDSVRSPGTGATVSCELPCGCRESNPCPLEEEPVLLTTEPSFQLPLLHPQPAIYFWHHVFNLWWVYQDLTLLYIERYLYLSIWFVCLGFRGQGHMI